MLEHGQFFLEPQATAIFYSFCRAQMSTFHRTQQCHHPELVEVCNRMEPEFFFPIQRRIVDTATPKTLCVPRKLERSL